MNNTEIPAGWINYPSDDPNVKYDFWKHFPTPDGLEVDVRIVAVQNKYQITSESASRSFVPMNESVIMEVTTLDEALAAAYQECKEWDDFVANRLKKRS